VSESKYYKQDSTLLSESSCCNESQVDNDSLIFDPNNFNENEDDREFVVLAGENGL
jgi:hypothetical protein